MPMQQKIDSCRIFIPDGLVYDCLNCGLCCSNWNLEITPDDFRNLSKNKSFFLLEKYFPNEPPVSYYSDEQRASLRGINDICVMFNHNSCLIHSKLGYKAKPYVCRKFPFVFSGTPDGIFVGVSFKCKAIRNKWGKPFADNNSSIVELLREKPPDNVGEDIIQVTEKYNITWDSYRLLEEFTLKCLEIPDIFNASWIPLGVVTSLIYNNAGKSVNAPALIDMGDLPEFSEDLNQKRNEPMFRYLTEFAASIISIIEKWNDSPDMENSRIILDGGSMESNTYRGRILVNAFREYLELPHAEWEESGFRSYLKHIVKWRKQLLRFGNLFTGLTALSFMPFMFTWYSFTSAISMGKEKPEHEHFMNALIILDKYFHHWNQSGFLFEEFGRRILKETDICT